MYYFIHVIFNLKNWVDLVTSWSRESWSCGNWSCENWFCGNWSCENWSCDSSHCSMFSSVCTALQQNRQLHRMLWVTFSLPFLTLQKSERWSGLIDYKGHRKLMNCLFCGSVTVVHTTAWTYSCENFTVWLIEAGLGVVWFICHYYKIFMQAFFLLENYALFHATKIVVMYLLTWVVRNLKIYLYIKREKHYSNAVATPVTLCETSGYVPSVTGGPGLENISVHQKRETLLECSTSVTLCETSTYIASLPGRYS